MAHRKTLLTLLALFACVTAVYFPIPTAPGQNTLLGSDYLQLHARRIRFAQESFSQGQGLPAWYPRELMGTPFWSNVQNFPFIPTRLPLLLLDPFDGLAVGAILAANLSALFSFLFCRRLGMGHLGAAVAGWTFACAGYFACRVNAGHLPLLEAYPLLPLWLWLADINLHTDSQDRRAWLKQAALAFAGLCGALAGHPQLPLYAAIVTGLYLLYRGPLRRALKLCTVLALGIACGAFALWPMLQLIGRSTRVLPLAATSNDVTFPYARLGTFLFPWKDGWPEASLGVAGRPFTGYGDVAYFWDTVCYVGWLPIAAALFLLVRAAIQRKRPAPPTLFFAIVGSLALLTALPAAHYFIEKVPGTFLRSPARQTYVTTFALALAAGGAIHVLALSAADPRRRAVASALLVALLLGHALDLGAHGRAFIRMIAVNRAGNTSFEQQLRQGAGDGRVAIDYELADPYNRSVDDAGVFDSILLARPYAALMSLADMPAGYNEQNLNGSSFSERALATTGVRVVVTLRTRPDLEFAGGGDTVRVYTTRNPAPRAAFFPPSSALFLDDAAAHAKLRDPAHDVRHVVMLPPGGNTTTAQTSPIATAPAAPAVTYTRPSSDEIQVRVRSAEAGYLRVLESWDPGWRATLNGRPTTTLPADTTFLSVIVPPGDSDLRLTYHTPGATTGLALSLAGLAALVALLTIDHRRSVRTP